LRKLKTKFSKETVLKSKQGHSKNTTNPTKHDTKYTRYKPIKTHYYIDKN